MAPPFPDLGTIWRSVVNFISRLLYARIKTPPQTAKKKVCTPQSVRTFWRRKEDLSLLPGFEHRTRQHLVYRSEKYFEQKVLMKIKIHFITA
jgi:hypothetical protein